METFQNILIKYGTKLSENKYLDSIKNAFQTIIPLIISGAIALLWSHVIVNENSGLGALWSPIMKLSFLNPAFDAINFATIGSITIWITYLIGKELGLKNGVDGTTSGLLSLAGLISTAMTLTTILDDNGEIIGSVSGIFASTIGSEGLFTGIIVAVLVSELFKLVTNIEAIKIKLPEQVPQGVAKPFEYVFPVFLVLTTISILGLIIVEFTGVYINELILRIVQRPLLQVGGSLPGILILTTVSTLLWTIGLHGDNIIGGVINPIMTTLTLENTNAIAVGLEPTNIINAPFQRIFFGSGGTGMMLSLTIALFIFAKRDENKAIGKLALAPNLFNIGEVNMFGLPVVLNTALIIPFILTPIICQTFGYVMTNLGIFPVMYIEAPWTTPPFLLGFLASGGNIMGGIAQLLAIGLGVLIYAPFIRVFEKQQELLEAEAN